MGEPFDVVATEEELRKPLGDRPTLEEYLESIGAEPTVRVGPSTMKENQ